MKFKLSIAILIFFSFTATAQTNKYKKINQKSKINSTKKIIAPTRKTIDQQNASFAEKKGKLTGYYAQGNHWYYLMHKSNKVYGYVEKKSGEYVGMFYGTFNSGTQRFSGKITCLTLNTIGRPGVMPLRFKFNKTQSSHELIIDKRTGGTVRAKSMIRLNYVKTKVLTSYTPKDELDPTGYWMRSGGNAGEPYIFFQKIGRDSLIGFSTHVMGEAPNLTSYLSQLIVAGYDRGSQSTTIKGYKIPIGKGSSKMYRAYRNEPDRRPVKPVNLVLDRGTSPFKNSLRAGGTKWNRMAIRGRTFMLDLISVKQLSHDACNDRLDYFGHTLFSSQGEPKGTSSKKNFTLNESPGFNKVLGNRFSGGTARVLKVLRTEKPNMVQNDFVTGGYFKLFLNDDDDLACGQDNDPVDISPRRGNGAYFYVDYFGRIKLHRPGTQFYHCRSTSRVGSVFRLKGETRPGTSGVEVGEIQLRVRIK